MAGNPPAYRGSIRRHDADGFIDCGAAWENDDGSLGFSLPVKSDLTGQYPKAGLDYLVEAQKNGKVTIRLFRNKYANNDDF